MSTICGGDAGRGLMDNIFRDLASLPPGEERFDTLLARPGVRIERIVSTGQASPPGFWYDQPQDEWVMVLTGAAGLLVEGEAERRLGPGDFAFLPARCRHRVEWTVDGEPTVWLAVHVDPRS
jgi:cupin 2 domain-containing protein